MNISNEYINDEIKNAIRVTQDFSMELKFHEIMLFEILRHENEKGICIVSQKEIAENIGKNTTWVQKAIKKLNAEDLCIEMIDKGMYKVHYTNIRERGVFQKVIQVLIDKETSPDFINKNTSIMEKYGVTKETVAVFRGYIGFMKKGYPDYYRKKIGID